MTLLGLGSLIAALKGLLRPDPKSPKTEISSFASPVPHRAVELAVHRQIGALIGELGGKLLVEVHAVTRRVTGMEITVLVVVGVGKNFVGLLAVRHVFLNSEIRDGDVEIQCRPHGDRGKISGAMAAGLDVIHVCERRDLFERSDTAAVDDGDAKIVDELLGDQRVGIPNRVEDLSNRKRRGGVLADDTKAFLKLCADSILKPEEMIWLEFFAQA